MVQHIMVINFFRLGKCQQQGRELLCQWPTIDMARKMSAQISFMVRENFCSNFFRHLKLFLFHQWPTIDMVREDFCSNFFRHQKLLLLHQWPTIDMVRRTFAQISQTFKTPFISPMAYYRHGKGELLLKFLRHVNLLLFHQWPTIDMVRENFCSNFFRHQKLLLFYQWHTIYMVREYFYSNFFRHQKLLLFYQWHTIYMVREYFCSNFFRHL